MSFIKRLSNLGKGMWRVNMGPRDPDDERRIQALHQELARLEAEADALGGPGDATRSTRTRPSSASALVEQATPDELLDARLLLLADELREGRIDRETYDRRCQALIDQATAEEPPQADAPPLKRTL